MARLSYKVRRLDGCRRYFAATTRISDWSENAATCSLADRPLSAFFTRLISIAFRPWLHQTPRLLLHLLLVVVLIHSPGTDVSAEGLKSPCDPHLRSASDFAYGYRERGNRCEGIYVKEVAGSPLLFASLTAVFEEYDAAVDPSLCIGWSAPSDTTVNLRAYGLRRKLYYRMDAMQVPGKNTFVWPLDVVGALGIRPQDVGVVAWTTYSLSGNEINLFLPVRITRDSPVKHLRTYHLKLLPSRELAEVFLTLVKLDSQDIENSVLIKARPLGYGFYPAERPIAITLPHLEAAGFYRIEIGAVLRTEGSVTLDVTFYHAGA